MRDPMTPTLRVRRDDHDLLGARQRRHETAPGGRQYLWEEFVVDWFIPEAWVGEPDLGGGPPTGVDDRSALRLGRLGSREGPA